MQTKISNKSLLQTLMEAFPVQTKMQWKFPTKMKLNCTTEMSERWQRKGEMTGSVQPQRLKKTLQKGLKSQSWLSSSNVILAENVSILNKNWILTVKVTTRHCLLLKRYAALYLVVNCNCLQFTWKGTRKSFLSKKVPPLLPLVHHLLCLWM